MSTEVKNQDEVLQIEWGNFTRSEAVEEHLKTKSKKILDRAKDATHLIISLSTDVSNKTNKAMDLNKVHFELRFPKHQDLFCQSEGNNLYEVITHCKEQMLRLLQERKTMQKHDRHENRDIKKSI